MPSTISSLCAKYQNEDVHSSFVAATTTRIFNAVCKTLNLSPSLKPLLSAAALLHDVQYANQPYNHAAKSAALVLSQKINGFTKTDHDIIAAVIALHKKDYSATMHSRLLKDPVVKKSALVLGAILRIADGLDHGHVQNCTIVSIKKTATGFTCLCKSPGYHGNCSWAQAKADLWKQVFKCSILIVEKPDKKNGLKYEGIVHKNDTVLEAFRRLMYLNYRIYTENIPAMLLEKNCEPLHDARIALRRMRTLISVFKPFLDLKKCIYLDNHLRSLALQLSPQRDNDVWSAFLLMLKKDPAFSHDKEFAAFCSKQATINNDSLEIILTAKSHAIFLRALNRFIRIELSQLIKTKHPVSLKTFGARKLVWVYTRVLAKPLVKKEYVVDKMHSLRKLCRKGRYYSEFFAVALDKKDACFCKLFKAMADALGDLHDTDVALEKLQTLKSPAVKKICFWLIDEKKKHYLAYRKSFSALCSPAVVDRINLLQTQARLQNRTISFFCDSLLKSDTKKYNPRAKNALSALSFLAEKSSIIACNLSPVFVKKELTIKSLFYLKMKILQKKCLGSSGTVKGCICYINQLLKSNKSHCFVGYWPLFSKILNHYIVLSSQQKNTLKKSKAFCLSFSLQQPGIVVEIEWSYSKKQLTRIASNGSL